MERRTASLKSVPIPSSFYDERQGTSLAWLGMAGAVVNSRGTIVFIDPLISHGESPEVCETGYRLRLPLPVLAEHVPRAHAVCYTHADNDHFGLRTAEILNARLQPKFIVPKPIYATLRDSGIDEKRLVRANDFESIPVGSLEIHITPALHDWQKVNPWQRGDCCGFLLKAPDGTIWHPGDTRLIPELYEVRGVDVLLFDVAPVSAHLGPAGSAAIARTSGARMMVAYHYGTFDLPAGSFGGCDPMDSLPYVADLPGKFVQPDLGEVLKLPISAP